MRTFDPQWQIWTASSSYRRRIFSGILSRTRNLPIRRTRSYHKATAALKYILRRLRRVILTPGVVLIHDNTRPHSAVVTQQLLEQVKWDASDHPAYSPYLATSDFHLFPQLKNWPGSQRFQENEEFQYKGKAPLTSLAATFFEEGIGNLVYRYDKCLNLHGDYVEK
ncbi:hypothetical protein AVEN_63462-1 [Araneus ventricosus]|uniref:Histone-lysine N-methyltransferase SETMAR n=1 Tax=Araneus ventricosus TaxID=182803 RepID=A0A4Y2CSV1_ARAVE|nr:hypothetical protein AVEN_63462-1 [Araneus ventricosus]